MCLCFFQHIMRVHAWPCVRLCSVERWRFHRTYSEVCPQGASNSNGTQHYQALLNHLQEGMAEGHAPCLRVPTLARATSLVTKARKNVIVHAIMCALCPWSRLANRGGLGAFIRFISIPNEHFFLGYPKRAFFFLNEQILSRAFIYALLKLQGYGKWMNMVQV